MKRSLPTTNKHCLVGFQRSSFPSFQHTMQKGLNMKKIAVMATALTLCLGAVASAANIHYTLYLGKFAQGPGTYKLTARTPAGESAGIAAYSVELLGNGNSILTLNHNS